MARTRKPKAPKEFSIHAWLISALRRISRRYPPLNNALNKRKREYYIQSKHGKQMRRVEFQCASCDVWFPRKQIQADHVVPVVNPATGFPQLEDGTDDWTTYLKGMLATDDFRTVKENAFQPLCKPCHTIKTSNEREVRKAAKAKKETV